MTSDIHAAIYAPDQALRFRLQRRLHVLLLQVPCAADRHGPAAHERRGARKARQGLPGPAVPDVGLCLAGGRADLDGPGLLQKGGRASEASTASPARRSATRSRPTRCCWTTPSGADSCTRTSSSSASASMGRRNCTTTIGSTSAATARGTVCMRAIDCCKEHQVEFNTLTLVNHLTADHPDEVFDFLIESGRALSAIHPVRRGGPADGANRGVLRHAEAVRRRSSVGFSTGGCSSARRDSASAISIPP